MKIKQTKIYIRRKKGQRAIRAAIAAGEMVLWLAILSLGIALASVKSIDRHVENQDTMLCNSALVSGNKTWLTKCKCFYQGGDIRCLQK